jgi:hypothetical protein
MGLHLSWTGNLGGWWDEITFTETRDTGFLLARLEQLWPRVPRYKPLSIGVVLLDLVPASHHQPDLFAADNDRRQKLSPLVDRINDRYGRCSIGFGLFPSDVRAFKGHAAFHRVPESWEFLSGAGIPCRAVAPRPTLAPLLSREHRNAGKGGFRGALAGSPRPVWVDRARQCALRNGNRILADHGRDRYRMARRFPGDRRICPGGAGSSRRPSAPEAAGAGTGLIGCAREDDPPEIESSRCALLAQRSLSLLVPLALVRAGRSGSRLGRHI